MFQSRTIACYTRERVKREEKGNPPTLSTLSLYTIHLPPSNHSSCSDIPSESHPMILHTTPLFLIVTTMPPLLTSQHLSSLLYLYQIIPPPSFRFFRVFQRLRLSVTQFLPHLPYLSSIFPKYLRTFLRRDSYHRMSMHSRLTSTFCASTLHLDLAQIYAVLKGITTWISWHYVPFMTWSSSTIWHSYSTGPVPFQHKHVHDRYGTEVWILFMTATSPSEPLDRMPMHLGLWSTNFNHYYMVLGLYNH